MHPRSSLALTLSIVALTALMVVGCAPAATPALPALAPNPQTGVATAKPGTSDAVLKPTATPSNTPTATVTMTPTASLAEQIEAAWGASDWPQVILLLKRGSPVDNDKLYAAYYNYCQQLLASGNRGAAAVQCQNALDAKPDGAEARQAILALTPTATRPPPTATRPARPQPARSPL